MIDPARILEHVTAYRARSYTAAVSDMLVAIATGNGPALRDARERLGEVIGATMGVAEVVGATLTLQAAAQTIPRMGKQAMRADTPYLLRFADLPAQTVLPRVTFEEAVQDMVERTPTTLRSAAERTAARISQLYSEGTVVAFVKAAEQAVTERVQDLITQAVREGISEARIGNVISMDVERIRRETDAWSEGYSRMAFRTNLNTGVTAGRFRQAQDPDIAEVIPAFRFDAVGDSDTRDNHGAADGIILLVNNPQWNRIAPPLGYNCRCMVSFVSTPELERMGRIRPNGTIIEDRVPPGAFPDKGFRHTGRPDLFITAGAA